MVPYRTGLTTIRLLLRKVCELLLTYDAVIREVLPENQWVYVDALQQACNDFMLNTTNPRP